MSETTAPVKKAMYKPTKIWGNPKISPIKITYLTSPNPMPFPRVTAHKQKKNKKEPIADIK